MTATPEVERLRAFLKHEAELAGERENFETYNILSALRGNDNLDEGDYKYLTMLIRSYSGFINNTCSGLLYGYRINEYTANKLVDLIIKVYDTDSTSLEHYPFHLAMAIKSIGKFELIQYVRDKTKTAAEIWTELQEQKRI